MSTKDIKIGHAPCPIRTSSLVGGRLIQKEKQIRTVENVIRAESYRITKKNSQPYSMFLYMQLQKKTERQNDLTRFFLIP